MKENDAHVDFEHHQLILYVEKEDGSYGPIQTGSEISKNHLDDFWLKKKNLQKSFIKRILSNEVSPIEYFMTMQELSPAELASRAGINKRTVKKHLDAKYFKKATVDMLERYAAVFDIPVVNLFQVVTGRLIENRIDENTGLETKNDSFIVHMKTENPLFVITKIENQ